MNSMFPNMKSMKSALGYLLWLVGARKILPRSVVNSIHVLDCGEKIQEVAPSNKLIVSSKTGGVELLRTDVIRRLIRASQMLDNNMTLILIEGFRSRERQAELWEAQLKVVKGAHPDKSEEEQERITRLSVAKPVGMGGGHQTGGAVDVTLGDENGVELDMGTLVQEFSELTPTESVGLSEEVQSRRDLLLNIMNDSGFSNFPGEWWHFSYGDQMWAAYKKRKKAIYGPL